MVMPFRTRFLRRDKRIMTRMHWTPMHRFFNLIILDIVKALYLINYLKESEVGYDAVILKYGRGLINSSYVYSKYLNPCPLYTTLIHTQNGILEH